MRNDVRYRVIVEDGFSKPLEKFKNNVVDTDQMSQKLNNGMSKFKGLVAQAFAVGTVIAFAKQIYNVTAEFQKYNAVLTNTLGSANLTKIVFADIKELAAETPFSVRELTESYVKLANQGFRPTSKEIVKLGDLASSTGKSIDQLAEALIDAQTGEFERLKEFGIRAKKEGDKVTFTFKGVKKQVDFTSEAMRNYVVSLGDVNGVTGAMASIAATASGKVSALGDSWDSLLNTIGDAQTGPFASVVETIDKMVKGLETALMTADQIQKKVVDTGAKRRKERIDAKAEEEVKAAMRGGMSEDDARLMVYGMQERKLADDLKIYKGRAFLAERALQEFEAETKGMAVVKYSMGGYAERKKQLEEELRLSQVLLNSTDAAISNYGLMISDLEQKKSNASTANQTSTSTDTPKASVSAKTKSVNDSVNSIVGAAPKVFNINIGALINENKNIIENATGIADLKQFERRLIDVLTRTVNDAQIAIG